ncbi:hypothetical protein RB653_000476 [Dictyostelium firmibasis]|uniref:Cathepsin propeptide inhibitor domain-containing protein n=1 Tax=Dictyostelium firmibasis TaxID=79012 RepID=A0AAN7YQP0_9MYCE
MKIIVLGLLILGCITQLINCQGVPSDSILFQQFVNWMDNYGIFYTDGDMQTKFQSWKANLLEIANLNANLNVPDVLYTVTETPVSNLRTLLDAEPSVVQSFPGQDVPKFEINQYSDLTASEFSNIYAGADASLAISEGVAAATLSTGAIVGIAVGGSVALIGATAATVLIVKKKRQNKKPQISHPTTPSQDVKMKPTNGIDLLNRTENQHRSITARAFYS